MSTPEHVSPDAMESQRRRDAELYEHAANPTRTTQAISWAGWHIGEIVGVTVPLGLAATAWDGFYVLSGIAALAWAAHEIRLRRKAKAIRAERTPGAGESE
jgi:hypothetical protein